MGTLNLPSSGTVYIDTNPVIYSVEKVEPYSSLLNPVWFAASLGQFTVITSELTWLEALTRPLRDKNVRLEAAYRAFLTAREINLIPVTLTTWEKAAYLRGTGLKTPDALHAATSFLTACSVFITNDAGFKRVPGLPVTLLSEQLSP